MRKVISLILDYFLILIVGFAIGMFIFVQYFDSISLVAGERYFVPKEVVLYGIFCVLPIIFIILPFALILYKIRHRSNPKSTFITFIVLSLVNWFGFYPLTLKLQTVYEKNLYAKNYNPEQKPLTKGYFRKANAKLYYFNKKSDLDSANVIIIEDSKNPGNFAEENIIDVSEKSDFEKFASPFRDPLIKETVTNIPYPVINIFSSIKSQALHAWNYGFVSWICFCSLGFALCSIYGVVKFSHWRMVNVLGAFILSGIVIWFNDFYYSQLNSSARNFLQSLFYEGGRLNFFIDKGIEFPLVLINMTFFVVLLIIGILVAILRRKEEK